MFDLNLMFLDSCCPSLIINRGIFSLPVNSTLQIGCGSWKGHRASSHGNCSTKHHNKKEFIQQGMVGSLRLNGVATKWATRYPKKGGKEATAFSYRHPSLVSFFLLCGSLTLKVSSQLPRTLKVMCFELPSNICKGLCTQSLGPLNSGNPDKYNCLWFQLA